MPIPTYEQFMLPLLHLASDGQEYHIQTAVIALADQFNLSEEDRTELLNSGKKTVLNNRVAWAKTYLSKALLVDNTRRGYFRITQRGFNVLTQNPSYIDKDFLKQFEEFRAFQSRSKSSDSQLGNDIDDAVQQTPQEIMDTTYKQLRQELADELLDYILSASPAFFERLVVDLLLAMGYGSALQDAGKTIGRSGDGGIDGFIQEDKLGLDVIYLQAKRWAQGNSVGRPHVQSFAGSLLGTGASKGVFITTSHFTPDAVDYANNLQNLKLILINGEQLANLMIEHNVGVNVQKNYTVKQIDENYFPDGI